ncbi:hypothetical protein DV736_g493, partial [Chaetothyriales sp. CBS 134916]
MAQTEPARPQYPPPEDANQAAYYGQQQSPRGPPAPRDERAPYRPAEPGRQGQYAPDPRVPASYPPPGQWPNQQHGAYPPPAHHYPDPQHAAYQYPPPRADMSQPPQPLQPDAYRLPPPYPPQHYHYPYPPTAAPAPAPRQRTAIACKYCRKRKIRCSGYDSSPDGRCQNCVRFNQQCLFHPVSSQATFVPVSAVYGPSARPPGAGAGERPGENGAYTRNGEQPPMLYGAHGQPLGPAGPSGQPQYAYPPQGYPPYPYPPQGHYATPPQPGHPYEPQGQAPPPPQDDRVSLKRPPPEDDPHNENSHAAQSPHPSSKPRHSTYDSHTNSNGSYGYPESSNPASTSPATSIMSHQSFPPQPHANDSQSQKGNVSPPAGLTPSSVHSFHSPLSGPVRDEGKTPPPNQPGSAGSSVNGRSGMKVHEMLGNHHGAHTELRGKNDNDMLNKLDRKK